MVYAKYHTSDKLEALDEVQGIAYKSFNPEMIKLLNLNDTMLGEYPNIICISRIIFDGTKDIAKYLHKIILQFQNEYGQSCNFDFTDCLQLSSEYAITVDMAYSEQYVYFLAKEKSQMLQGINHDVKEYLYNLQTVKSDKEQSDQE